MAEVRYLLITTNLEHMHIFHEAKHYLERHLNDIEIIPCYQIDEGISRYRHTVNIYMILLCLDLRIVSLVELLPKLRHFNRRTPVFVVLDQPISLVDMISLYQFGSEICLQMELTPELLIALCRQYDQRVHTYLLEYPSMRDRMKERNRAVEGVLRFDSHDLVLDRRKRRATLHNREIHITSKEFDLLYYLAQNADRVLTHNQITEHVWKEEPGRANLSAAISRLRREIHNADFILNVYGTGYLFSSR